MAQIQHGYGTPLNVSLRTGFLKSVANLSKFEEPTVYLVPPLNIERMTGQTKLRVCMFPHGRSGYVDFPSLPPSPSPLFPLKEVKAGTSNLRGT